jgi:ribosomal protein S18 acetylase RimI-like enzyme
MLIHELTDFSSAPALRDVIAEYMRSLPFNIDYQSPDKELEDLASLYSNNSGGAMFIAMDGNEIAGCVAVKKLTHMHPQPGVRTCEMKRLYVRPVYRGRNLGHQLADAIIQKAGSLGYHEMYLDTHREAQALAIAMYKRMGFTECEDYHPNPGNLLCLRLDLR